MANVYSPIKSKICNPHNNPRRKYFIPFWQIGKSRLWSLRHIPAEHRSSKSKKRNLVWSTLGPSPAISPLFLYVFEAWLSYSSVVRLPGWPHKLKERHILTTIILKIQNNAWKVPEYIKNSTNNRWNYCIMCLNTLTTHLWCD